MIKQLLIEAVSPVIVTLASLFISVAIGVATDRFRAWSGIEIEARHREALQSALANAAKIIVAGGTLSSGVDYVRASVPDALKALKAEEFGRINELLQPHLSKLAR